MASDEYPWKNQTWEGSRRLWRRCGSAHRGAEKSAALARLGLVQRCLWVQEATLQRACEKADNQKLILGGGVREPTEPGVHQRLCLCCRLWFPCWRGCAKVMTAFVEMQSCQRATFGPKAEGGPTECSHALSWAPSGTEMAGDLPLLQYPSSTPCWEAWRNTGIPVSWSIYWRVPQNWEAIN